MKNNFLIDIMDETEYLNYKERITGLCNKIGFEVNTSVTEYNNHIEVYFKTKGGQFNPLCVENYKNRTHRYGFGRLRLECIEKHKLLDKLTYEYLDGFNILKLQLSQLFPFGKFMCEDINDLNLGEECTEFIFQSYHFNTFSKERIPREINYLNYFLDLVDYYDFLNEYFLNCVMYNNIFHDTVQMDLSQIVLSDTKESDIINNILEGKDRIITDTQNIQRIIHIMEKIGLNKYYLFVE